MKRLYFYNISQWDFIEYNSGSTAGQQTNYLASDTNFSNTPVLFPSLGFSVDANSTYTFEYHLSTICSESDIHNFNFNAPGGAGSVVVLMYLGFRGGLTVAITSSTVKRERVTNLDTYTGSFFTTSYSDNMIRMSGVYQSGASAGSTTFSARNDATSQNSRMRAGSYFLARKVL